MTIRTHLEFASARHAMGWSVSQCARFCNVDDRTVRRWEIGAGNSSNGRDPHPSACRLMELATRDPGALMLLKALVPAIERA